MYSLHVFTVALLLVVPDALVFLGPSPYVTQAAAVPLNCPLELSVSEHSPDGTLLANLPERLGLAALAASHSQTRQSSDGATTEPVTLRLTSPSQSQLVRYEYWSSATAGM